MTDEEVKVMDPKLYGSIIKDMREFWRVLNSENEPPYNLVEKFHLEFSSRLLKVIFSHAHLRLILP